MNSARGARLVKKKGLKRKTHLMQTKQTLSGRNMTHHFFFTIHNSLGREFFFQITLNIKPFS